MVAVDRGRVYVAGKEHEFTAQNIAHGKDLDRWGFRRATPVLVEPRQHDRLVRGPRRQGERSAPALGASSEQEIRDSPSDATVSPDARFRQERGLRACAGTRLRHPAPSWA